MNGFYSLKTQILDPADWPAVQHLTEAEALRLAGDVPPWEPTRGSLDTVGDYFRNHTVRERRAIRKAAREAEEARAQLAQQEQEARARWEAQQAAQRARQAAAEEAAAAERAAWEAAAPERRRAEEQARRERETLKQQFRARAFKPGDLVTLCGPNGQRYPAIVETAHVSFTEGNGRVDYVLLTIEHRTRPTISREEHLRSGAPCRNEWTIERP